MCGGERWGPQHPQACSPPAEPNKVQSPGRPHDPCRSLQPSGGVSGLPWWALSRSREMQPRPHSHLLPELARESVLKSEDQVGRHGSCQEPAHGVPGEAETQPCPKGCSFQCPSGNCSLGQSTVPGKGAEPSWASTPRHVRLSGSPELSPAGLSHELPGQVSQVVSCCGLDGLGLSHPPPGTVQVVLRKGFLDRDWRGRCGQDCGQHGGK